MVRLFQQKELKSKIRDEHLDQHGHQFYKLIDDHPEQLQVNLIPKEQLQPHHSVLVVDDNSYQSPIPNGYGTDYLRE